MCLLCSDLQKPTLDRTFKLVRRPALVACPEESVAAVSGARVMQRVATHQSQASVSTDAPAASAGIRLISDVIDFSQADDGAMIAYGLSDQLDDLKVHHIKHLPMEFRQVMSHLPGHEIILSEQGIQAMAMLGLQRSFVGYIRRRLHRTPHRVHLADAHPASGGGGAACGRHKCVCRFWRESGHLLLASQGTYAGLPDFLTQVVESELARIPRAFARSHPDLRWTIVYLPQVCCLCECFSAFWCMRGEAWWLAV
jgi:hypothetical protein